MQTELAKIRALNERRADAHMADAGPSDDFDLLDVAHFYNVFEHHFDRLVDVGPSGRSPDKRVVLEYIKTMTEFRNVVAHPVEQDLSFADAFRCLDTLRRLLETLQISVAVKETLDLIETIRSTNSLMSEIRDPLLNNLPPAESVVTRFIGRDQELAQLREWLDNPDRRRWAICGEGGTGKSALAYRFAQEVVDRAPFYLRCVFWLSAKKRRFVDGSTVAIRNPDFHNLETALDLLALEYGKDRLLNQTLQVKKNAVLKLLAKAPALLIVDDIDSIDAAESEVVEFFLNDVSGVRSKTKVLLTSRQAVFGMASYTVEVKGLEDDKARLFIESRAANFRVERALLTKTVIHDIIRITNGSPLYMEDLLRLTQFIGPAEAIRAWERERGDAAREYALKREFEMLPEDARNLLIAACIQPMAISAIEAKSVLELSDIRFDGATEKLRGVFLMQKPTLIKNEVRYEVNANVRKLVMTTVQDSDQYQRIKAAYAANSGNLAGKGRGETRSIVRQAGLMVRMGHLVEAEQLLLKAMTGAGRKPVLLSEIGWVYANWKPPRAVDARHAFEESIALNKTSDDAFVRWCRLELELKEYTKACAVSENGLNLFPKSFELTRLAGFAFSQRADEVLRYRQNETAAAMFGRSTDYYWAALDLPHPTNLDDREVDASLFRGLLHNYRHLHQPERILATFSEWSQRHPEDETMAFEGRRVLRDYSRLSASERQDIQQLIGSLLDSNGNQQS